MIPSELVEYRSVYSQEGAHAYPNLEYASQAMETTEKPPYSPRHHLSQSKLEFL